MKRFNKILIALLICTISTLVSACGNSTASTGSEKDTSWKKVKENNELVVGFCAQYPPFESLNEKTGEFEGFDVDMAKALGEELGVEVKFIDAEWQALLGGVNKGDYDVLITCMNKKEASKENVSMTDVYYNFPCSISVTEDNTDINSVEDLKGKIIGVQMGSGSEIEAEKIEGVKEIKRYDYTPAAFSDLKAGRIDAVVEGYARSLIHYKETGETRVVEEPLAYSENIMVLSSKSIELTEKLNESLAAIKENGKYDAALKKWLSLDEN